MLWRLKTLPGTKQVLSTSYYHNYDDSYALSHYKGPSIRKCYTNDQMLRALVSGFVLCTVETQTTLTLLPYTS